MQVYLGGGGKFIHVSNAVAAIFLKRILGRVEMEFNMAVSTWGLREQNKKKQKTKAKTKKLAIYKQSISLRDIQTM